MGATCTPSATSPARCSRGRGRARQKHPAASASFIPSATSPKAVHYQWEADLHASTSPQKRIRMSLNKPTSDETSRMTTDESITAHNMTQHKFHHDAQVEQMKGPHGPHVKEGASHAAPPSPAQEHAKPAFGKRIDGTSG